MFVAFLALMMIPNELVIITDFVTITDMNLRNTFTGLILPSVTSVFYIYLLKENFEQVPDRALLCGKIDGTSDLRYLFKVLVPICRPTVITVIILKSYRVLEFICLAEANNRRSKLLSGVERHTGDTGERLRRGEYSCDDGSRCGGVNSACYPVSGFRNRIMEGISREGQKDDKVKKSGFSSSCSHDDRYRSIAFRLPRLAPDE